MFFKEKKGDTKTSDLARVAALLIHAAKIDENFSKGGQRKCYLVLLIQR